MLRLKQDLKVLKISIFRKMAKNEKKWAETPIFSYLRNNMDPQIYYNSAKSELIINISKGNVQIYVLHMEDSFQGPSRK